ncbi:alpha/beta hydrolase [Lentilactobacillus sp. Marseille-Q4993]|uniref:alpha/beta hydrolase n=1 Tax=Lentilactobacillus sp. Marseille-Q4993 TaxID=3039492 RepID=UPI0024BCDB64|nr:alpha/beta hydrolase [Lentilactobacillus sp. Marseille-Q4993]
MSFKARRQFNKLAKNQYKSNVSHSFLKPNQRYSVFNQPEFEGKVAKIDTGQIVTIEPEQAPIAQIIYFHGGAMTVPMNEDQLRLVTRIGDMVPATIKVVDYPLLFQSKSIDLIQFSQRAIKEVITNSGDLPTYILADSAGTIPAVESVLATFESVAGIILISPWFDPKLHDQKIKRQSEDDIFLDYDVLKQIGDEFEDSLGEYKLHDVFDPANLRGQNFLVFYSQNEMLSPDTERFIEVAERAVDTTVKSHKFTDAFHDYVLWPDLPETKKTEKLISAFIKDRRDA